LIACICDDIDLRDHAHHHRSVVAALSSRTVAASWAPPVSVVLLWQDVWAWSAVDRAPAVDRDPAGVARLQPAVVSRPRRRSAGLNTGIILAWRHRPRRHPAGLVFAFTMMSMIVSDLRVVGQLGMTIGIGLLVDTLTCAPS